ncbi:hypothetical protein RJ639_037312 [Escallonia herrerae]|uniref:VDE lipocalin domain-containing protein n=1 Tax=Escallonia herrerae TaxID=1293975 RepID=A0AA88WUJ3_9ASTE|nr:hypothetical protein RJ639_037312 [Escallonia herrerae]
MAFTLHSLFLSNDESISLHNRLRFIGEERFHRKGVDPNCRVIMVKMRYKSKKSRYFHLSRAYSMWSGLEAKFSNVVSCGRKRICPVSTNASIEEKQKDGLQMAVTLVFWRQWNRFVRLALILACAFVVTPKADAVDALKTCSCLLKECSALECEMMGSLDMIRVELAKCIANPSCAANVACLQTCNNRPDETECQIKCGDLFENSVVDEFNECAVSRKKCVPRKSDVGEFPVPDPAVLVQNFNINNFSGRWFITSGLNSTFDAFDCQLHEFHTESNKLVGNLSWRIRTPDSGFFTRSAVQKFVQDPTYPGILYNHDNKYLHYQDDWYILSSKIENKPEDYIFVYYRGRNDAWDGYGGAVVYTRSAVLPESIVPELEKAALSVGRNFDSFIRTNNTCGPEPPLVERLEKTVEEGEKTIIREVEEIEGDVEKVREEIEGDVEKVRDTEMTLFRRLAEGLKELERDEENFLKELSKEEMDVLSELKMEASQVEKLFGGALPLRKLR